MLECNIYPQCMPRCWHLCVSRQKLHHLCHVLLDLVPCAQVCSTTTEKTSFRLKNQKKEWIGLHSSKFILYDYEQVHLIEIAHIFHSRFKTVSKKCAF